MTGSGTTPAATDQALADRVSRNRDEGAFRALYGRHTPALYQLALRLMAGNEPEAEEAVQETWIRAVEKLEQFRWESSLRTWLKAIAVNVCRQTYRNRGRAWTEVTDDMLPVPSGDPSLRIDLEHAIAALPPGYRSVIVLHDVEGHTHEEIGRLLSISSGTSKAQLFRARRAVRALLTNGHRKPSEETKRWNTTQAPS